MGKKVRTAWNKGKKGYKNPNYPKNRKSSPRPNNPKNGFKKGKANYVEKLKGIRKTRTEKHIKRIEALLQTLELYQWNQSLRTKMMKFIESLPPPVQKMEQVNREEKTSIQTENTSTPETEKEED